MLDLLNIIARHLGWILMAAVAGFLLVLALREVYSRYYWRNYFEKPWWKRGESLFSRKVLFNWKDD